MLFNEMFVTFIPFMNFYYTASLSKKILMVKVYQKLKNIISIDQSVPTKAIYYIVTQRRLN